MNTPHRRRARHERDDPASSASGYARWRLWLLTIGLLAACSVCGVSLDWANTQAQRTRTEFFAARARWAQTRPETYRLVLEYHSPPFVITPCRRSVIIRNEDIIDVERSACSLIAMGSGSLSVSGIFDHYEQFLTSTVCGPNGCACDGIIALSAEYDAHYGYPIAIQTRLAPDTLNPAYWWSRRFGQTCTQYAFSTERFSILSVTEMR